MGFVGKDPDIRTTPSQKQVVSFSLATSKMVKGEKKTSWHTIISWSKSADRIKKGDKLYIEGEIDHRTWDDKEDPSKKHYKTEIVSNFFLWVNPKQDTPTNHGGEAVYTQPGSKDEFAGNANMGQNEPPLQTDDDLPF